MANFIFNLSQEDYQRFMQKLKKLSVVEQTAIVSKGIREGLNEILKQGKSNLAARNGAHTGNLKKSFKISINKKESKGYSGFKRPEGSIAHIIDRGTTVRTTKLGYNRGKIIGSNFWTDAVEDKSGAALKELKDSIEISISRITN